ncbi:hypothetical protein [Alkaliphilus serpentinus]|uniref:Cohesin domain-containing protein n=1 Tax=Alkaliphilus serpentinus TaxID=1482731 RepID=A0A833M894_9FIRM|nr:hypothetical protein [Alkaliphilus serpentinus]KAB3532180.1 hypothetical protein F8153_02680 [Alkaliphilus serpentinus]
MIKKVFICSAIVFIGLGISSVTAYGTDTVPVASFQVVTPDEDITTSNNSVMLEFIAPEGTKVIIQVYYNNSVVKNEETFTASADAIEVEIGALEIGMAEVKLKERRNKIEITAIYPDGTEKTVVRMINVEDLKYEPKLPAKLLPENRINPLTK